MSRIQSGQRSEFVDDDALHRGWLPQFGWRELEVDVQHNDITFDLVTLADDDLGGLCNGWSSCF